MLRRDVDIQLLELPAATAQEVVEQHHWEQPYSGDFFLGSRQLGGPHHAIELGGERVGVAVAGADGLSLCTVEPHAKRYRRQILEAVLSATGATEAYAASWDRHHIELFGNFASSIDNQAYQFQLLSPDDLVAPAPGLMLHSATEDDLGYLEGTGFIDDIATSVAEGQVRVARLDGSAVGIGIVASHPLNPARSDIGMFSNPEVRGSGIGRSIVVLAAQEVLAAGGTPVAGCWWRNAESRRTLEAAGMTCVGAIFRFGLDPDRFRVGRS